MTKPVHWPTYVVHVGNNITFSVFQYFLSGLAESVDMESVLQFTAYSAPLAPGDKLPNEDRASTFFIGILLNIGNPQLAIPTCYFVFWKQAHFLLLLAFGLQGQDGIYE